MAQRLLATGHSVQAFDPDLGKVEMLEPTGGQSRATPAAAVAGVDVAAVMAALLCWTRRRGSPQPFNQLLCGVHIAVAAEALDYAAALGLDARAVWSAVRQGAAGSFMLADRGERMLDGPPEAVVSAINLFVKDLGLVREEATRVGSPTPLADAAEALFKEAAVAGLGDEDDSRVIEMIRRRRLQR
jgi:3-hydroxyisobutyrate dehydrogenase-like beta-hydroxyacid dehydrogenase